MKRLLILDYFRYYWVQTMIQILSMKIFSPLFYSCVIFSSGTTVRSWWVTDSAASSAGQSVISQVVQQLTTGWRTRWLTAALPAQFVSPSLSDVTTAGTVGSSFAKSKKKNFTCTTFNVSFLFTMFTCLLLMSHQNVIEPVVSIGVIILW